MAGRDQFHCTSLPHPPPRRSQALTRLLCRLAKDPRSPSGLTRLQTHLLPTSPKLARHHRNAHSHRGDRTHGAVEGGKESKRGGARRRGRAYQNHEVHAAPPHSPHPPPKALASCSGNRRKEIRCHGQTPSWAGTAACRQQKQYSPREDGSSRIGNRDAFEGAGLGWSRAGDHSGRSRVKGIDRGRVATRLRGGPSLMHVTDRNLRRKWAIRYNYLKATTRAESRRPSHRDPARRAQGPPGRTHLLLFGRSPILQAATEGPSAEPRVSALSSPGPPTGICGQRIARSLPTQGGIHRRCGGSSRRPSTVKENTSKNALFCAHSFSRAACAIHSTSSVLWRPPVRASQGNVVVPAPLPCHADWCVRRTPAQIFVKWVRCRPLHEHDGCRFPPPTTTTGGLCPTARQARTAPQYPTPRSPFVLA